MPQPGRSRTVATAALAMLVLLGGASADLHARPDSSTPLGLAAKDGGVTCSLKDYQELYGRAVRQDLREDLEQRRLQSEAKLRQRERELEARMEAAAGVAARRSQRERVLPGNWQLLNHSVRGSCCPLGAARSLASFDFSLEFRVFEDEWTAIPLIDAQTIVADLAVHRAEVPWPQEWRQVQMGADALAVLRDREEVKDDEPWQDHTLVVNRSGLFRVKFRAHIHVQSNRNLHSLQLNLLHPVTSARLRLSREASSHLRELSVEPAAFLSQRDGEGVTDVEVTVPSSQKLGFKWRLQPGAAGAAAAPPHADAGGTEVPEPEAESPAQAVVAHDSFHSVEDGILRSTHSFKYLLDAEQSLSSAEIHFPAAVRVTSVAAHGMQTWRAVPLGANATRGGADGDGRLGGTAVHVAFKTSVISREVIVMVTTELEFDARSSRALPVPAALCQGVLRQAGSLAVVKVANVEIYQDRASGVSRVGVEDLPKHMLGRVGWPIVLAYKFLAPRHNVTLSVVQHEELSTLKAMADSGLYKVLVLDSQVMHNFLLVLQNTQQQYMEVQGIPGDAVLWALKVNSVATKPVRGEEGRLLVPLLVGTSSSTSSAKTSVDITWSTAHQPLGNNGTLSLDPPCVDLPVAALSVDVSLPERYEVKFDGTFRPVERFSQPQPSPVSYQTGEDVVPQGFDFASAPPPSSAGGAKGSAGVRAKVPRVGRRFLLEQLLILEQRARLAVAYRTPAEKTPPSWADSFRAALR